MSGNSGSIEEHGAELRHPEDDVVLPYPVGPVQCRSSGSRLHQEGNNQQRDAEGNHEAQRHHEIEHSLHFFRLSGCFGLFG